MSLNLTDDAAWMQRCLELARRAIGRTAPNPLVGSVIVQAGELVGEGFHPQAGQPHAEVFALRMAGDRAHGATLYVNLEPCNHYGRTPPCSDAIIAAGVRKVVVGMIDPDPRVAGGGIDRLRQAGIEVIVGIEEAACQQLNEAFVQRIVQRRPFGILKYAMTLDGKIATTTGHSAWVTGPAARTEVHQLRSICEAIVVGGNTIRHDNPLLTSRQAHTPLRVVLSRSLDLPATAQVWDTTVAPTLVVTELNVRPGFQAQLKQRGVEVLELPSLTPAAVMAHLYDRNSLNVLWECGGVLAAAAIRDGSIQKVLAFVAPKLIGGGPSPIADFGLTEMTQALPIERLTWRAIGPDLLLEGYLAQQSMRS